MSFGVVEKACWPCGVGVIVFVIGDDVGMRTCKCSACIVRGASILKT